MVLETQDVRRIDSARIAIRMAQAVHSTPPPADLPINKYKRGWSSRANIERRHDGTRHILLARSVGGKAGLRQRVDAGRRNWSHAKHADDLFAGLASVVAR